MLSTRNPLEWHFKQLDHSQGLSFRANFHFGKLGRMMGRSYEETVQALVRGLKNAEGGTRAETMVTLGKV